MQIYATEYFLIRLRKANYFHIDETFKSAVYPYK